MLEYQPQVELPYLPYQPAPVIPIPVAVAAPVPAPAQVRRFASAYPK
ncbi:MAG: hypothetical protein WBC68_09830 [Albidovulum sp.]